MKGVSVYIPVLGTAKELKYCLDGLLNQTQMPDEIILLHNDKSRRIQSIASRYSSIIRIVELSGPFTRSHVKNIALQTSRYDLVASLHVNCVPKPDWLKTLCDRMRNHPELLGAGGPLLEVHTDSLTNRYRCQHLHRDQGNSVIINPNLLHGGNTIYRRKPLLAIGGYNQALQNGEEDIELSSRIRQSGGRLLYDPKASAYRYRRDSLRSILTLQWQSLRQLHNLIQSPHNPKDVWYNGKQMVKTIWKNQILTDLRAKRFLLSALGMASITVAPLLEWKWYKQSPKYLVAHESNV